MSAYRHVDLRVSSTALALPFYEQLVPALGFTEPRQGEVWKSCPAAPVAREAGVLELSGPKEMPYGPGYYAVFFPDPCGNRLGVYVRPA